MLIHAICIYCTCTYVCKCMHTRSCSLPPDLGWRCLRQAEVYTRERFQGEALCTWILTDHFSKQKTEILEGPGQLGIRRVHPSGSKKRPSQRYSDRVVLIYQCLLRTNYAPGNTQSKKRDWDINQTVLHVLMFLRKQETLSRHFQSAGRSASYIDLKFSSLPVLWCRLSSVLFIHPLSYHGNRHLLSISFYWSLHLVGNPDVNTLLY